MNSIKKNNCMFFVALSILIFYIIYIFNEVFCINTKNTQFILSNIKGVWIMHESHIPFYKLEYSVIAAKINCDDLINKSNLAEYFYYNNNIFLRYSNKSVCNHINLLLGEYGDFYLNYPYSHSKIINYKYISDIDCIGDDKNQYISGILYAYEKNTNIPLILNSSATNNKNFNIIKNNIPEVEIKYYLKNRKNYCKHLIVDKKVLNDVIMNSLNIKNIKN